MYETMAEDIRSLRRRTELLAPAGRWEVLEAVVEAGADAVYLSGKRFQMRAHRSDFHFDDAALRDAAAYLHERGRRMYVTVNTLLAGHEVAEIRSFLELLEELRVDGAIVCDLATIAVARELGVEFELHASTMMNVHDVDQAMALRDLGISRVVTSRDISIQNAGRLGEAAGLDIEYFLHGDMCVAQSGQCSMSGVALGKSSNRGECMKPCRWQYDLVSLHGDEVSAPLKSGHLMALRDLALIRQIPDLIGAGICALKIEGRMRDAAYLGGLVGLYREALDQYYDWPGGYALGEGVLEPLFRDRVRDLSALTATGAPSNSTFFDTSGKREPLMLSNGAREADATDVSFLDAAPSPNGHDGPRRAPDLAVTVASPEAAAEALGAGAGRIYLSLETQQFGPQQWTAATLQKAMALVREGEADLGLRMPRVSGARAPVEWEALFRLLGPRPPDWLLVHHLGDLKRARQRFPEARVVADYGLNALNPDAARLLASLGAAAVTPCLEAGYDDVAGLAMDSPVPLELFAHGPITGMLLDHCLVAMNLTKAGSKDACRGPCRQMAFGLRDKKGAVRAIVTDQHCRNHILTERDLAILPRIDAFLIPGVASLRIEGQFYEPELVGLLTAAYRKALDAWKNGHDSVAPDRAEWTALQAAGPRSWNYGGYAQHATRSASTAEVMRALR